MPNCFSSRQRVIGDPLDDRRENFDIYLPVWLAKYNKLIFGSLYVASVAFALVRWAHASS